MQPKASDIAALAGTISSSNSMNVPINSLDPNPRQPRDMYPDESMRSLAESIRTHGIIQPLIVTLRANTGNGGARYYIIAGERRWRAAKLAGMTTVPVVIKTATQQQMLEMALIENLQREDLNPIETARAYQMLIEEFHLTQDEIARKVGKDRTTIANQIALLRLPIEIQDKLALNLDTFTVGHAKAMFGIPNPEDQIHLMNQIIAQEMSVRKAEDAARSYKEAALRLVNDRKGGGSHTSPDISALEDEFRRAVQLKVLLKRTAKGSGSLTITFANQEELDALYELLVMRTMQNEEF